MIVGLSGKALSGKDSAADYLIREYNFSRKVGFADNLKIACMEVFALSEQQVFSQKGKGMAFEEPVIVTREILTSIVKWMRKTHDVALEYKPYLHLLGVRLERPRDILQFVGTEVMRYYVPDYHREVVFRNINSEENVVVTDVRFPNEAENILSVGGFLVRVERYYACEGVKIDFNRTHESETALDNWTFWSYTIHNDGDVLECLYRSVDEMMDYLEKKNDEDNT